MDFAPDTRQFQINGPIPTSYSNDGTLGDGTIYRVYPAIYADGKEYIFEGPQSMPNYVLWSRTKNGANWVYTAELPDVGHKEILDLSTNGDLYQGQPRIKISGIAKFTGNAKSSMNFTWRILSATDNSTVAVGESLNLLFTPEGNHFDEISNSALALSSIAPGDYTFALTYASELQNTDGIIMATCPVTVRASAKSEYKVTSFVVENATAVNPDSIKLSAAIEGVSGYAYEDLRFDLFNDEMTKISEQKAPLYITAPGSTKVEITTSISNTTPGEKYYAKLLKQNFGSWVDLSDAVPFTIRESAPTHIVEVIVDGQAAATVYPNPAIDFAVISSPAEITKVTLCSLIGQPANVDAEISGTTARLDLRFLAKGLYLATITTANGSYTLKLLKK